MMDAGSVAYELDAKTAEAAWKVLYLSSPLLSLYLIFNLNYFKVSNKNTISPITDLASCWTWTPKFSFAGHYPPWERYSKKKKIKKTHKLITS
jgi:hypothetical protein